MIYFFNIYLNYILVLSEVKPQILQPQTFLVIMVYAGHTYEVRNPFNFKLLVFQYSLASNVRPMSGLRLLNESILQPFNNNNSEIINSLFGSELLSISYEFPQ